MSRATQLAFLSAALFLVLFTGTVGKPGLPLTLKADEPAYLLMALSLVEDQDVLVESHDFPRLLDSYPFLPTQNLILMSDDGWHTVFYGKPYLYSLLAAPLVVVFGANGLVATNALLFVLMIWWGARYLKQFNSEATSVLFAFLFFTLSPAWAYVFWLQPEILNLAAVTGAFYFLFRKPELTSRWTAFAAPASAACLAVGAYNKPVLLAFAMPLTYLLWRRDGLPAMARWGATLVVALGIFAGGSVLLTGHPSAYLGVSRGGIRVETPEAAVKLLEEMPARVEQVSTTANSWSWVFRKPPTNLREIRQSLGYFFWGRHTGLLLYLPFAVVSLFLWLIHRRERPEGWLVLGAIASIAMFFICVIPLNWHGGGGFIGNRYFLMAYPAFLFLVTTISPAWLIVPGAASAGLFLGTILFSPFGAPTTLPTLQSHTRNPPFQLFPFDQSLRKQLPGYSVFTYPRVALMGRKDVFMPDREPGGTPLVHAGVRAEVMVLTDRLIEGLFFEVTTIPPDNLIEIELAGDREVVRFENATDRKKRRVVELRPQKPPRTHQELGVEYYIYDMTVYAERGERIHDPALPSKIHFAGAKLDCVGRRDQITLPEHYRVEWIDVQVPETARPGTQFEAAVRLRNTSESPFVSDGAIPVHLTYRWQIEGSSDGPALRARFEEPVEAGAEYEMLLTLEAPAEAGDYQLVFDLVREHVGWFSKIASEVKTVPVRVE